MDFGLWKKNQFDGFGEKYFKVIMSDAKTFHILQNCHKFKIKDQEENDDESTIIQSSEEFLLTNDDDLIIQNHELIMAATDNQEMVLRPRFKNRHEILTANASINESDYGTRRLQIKQEQVELLLQPITQVNESKGLQSSKTVQLETIEEEQVDSHQPKLLFMALRKYLGGNNAQLKDIFDSTPKFQRTQYDVYKFTFMCELLNFFVLLFGFTEFNVSAIIYVYFLSSYEISNHTCFSRTHH